MFSECQEIDASEPLRQGDVIRCLNDSTTDPLWSLGLIVTADCDLAREKHGGRISWVPLIPVPSYLSMFYLPRRVTRFRDSLTDEIVGTARRAQMRSAANFPRPMSEERVCAWLLETSPERVAGHLALAGDERVRFCLIAQHFVALTRAIGADYSHAIAALSEAAFELGRAKGPEHARQGLIDDLARHLKDLPGDALFVTSVAPTLDMGYVAYLRVLHELGAHEVAVKRSQISTDMAYERVSRMKSRYIYALTQRLAAVFSAIGLPNEYESARDQYAAALGTME